jgi:hypothetical protein
MRTKFVFGLIASALFVLMSAFLLKQRMGPAAPAPIATAPAPAPQAESAPLPPPPVLPPVAPRVLTAEEQRAANDAEIDRLNEWSRNSDPQSLSNILADLTSPQKDVREAAIEAAKQFGSTNAIPALKAAAINSTDTDEQIEMLQAANFLTLPPIAITPPTPEQIQAAAQRHAQAQAMRQAQMQQQQAQNQNGQQDASPSQSVPDQGQPGAN